MTTTCALDELLEELEPDPPTPELPEPPDPDPPEPELEPEPEPEPDLAAGAAVAATFRMQTGGVAEQTDLACEALCGLSSAQVAQICNEERENLPPAGVEPAYEIWRQRLARRFALGSERTPEPKEAKS